MQAQSEGLREGENRGKWLIYFDWFVSLGGSEGGRVKPSWVFSDLRATVPEPASNGAFKTPQSSTSKKSDMKLGFNK